MPARSVRATDVAVGVSFVVAVIWTIVAGVSAGSVRVAVVLVASAAVLFLARILSSFSRIAVPVAVLVAAAITSVSARHELLSAGPLSGPFGYANAKGAFFMLAAIAGLMVAVGASSPILRVIGGAGAIAAALVPATTHVAASTVLIVALPLPLMLFSMIGRWASRLAIAMCGSLFILTLLATAILGTRAWPTVDGPVAIRIPGMSSRTTASSCGTKRNSS